MSWLEWIQNTADFLTNAAPVAPKVLSSRVGGQEASTSLEALQEGKSVCSDTNCVQLLFCGDEAFPAMLESIRKAKHHIHLQSMVFFSDFAGKTLLRELVNKVQEGVEVRILFEYFTTAMGDPFFHKGLSPFSVQELVAEMKIKGIQVQDSASFPLAWMQITEERLFLHELKEWFEIEKKLSSPSFRQDLLLYQETFINKATALFEDPLFLSLFQNFQKLSEKLPEPFRTLFTPIRYLRQFLMHDHRKMLIVDGKVGFCGGMNIGQEYLYLEPLDPLVATEEEQKKAGNQEPWEKWFDIALKIEGPLVNGLQRQFAERWNQILPTNQEEFPTLPMDSVDFFPVPSSRGNQKAWLLSQIPNQSKDIENRLLQEMKWATQSIRLSNPYLLHPGFLGLLLEKAREGLEVEVLVPDDHNDSMLHQIMLRSFVPWFREAGVQYHELKNHFTHAKLLVIDDKLVHIGSYNFNNRSALLDFECSVLVEDEALAKQVAERVFRKSQQEGFVQKEPQKQKLWDLDLELASKTLVRFFPDVF